MKVRRVRLAFDDSYFSGPAVNPAWPSTYIPEDVVPPISSLWVDEGQDPDRLRLRPRPRGHGGPDLPVRPAAQRFEGASRRSRAQSLPPEADDVASVSSAPLGEIVERTLEVSDNQAAEVLARHVGLAERQEGSFAAGAASVLDVLERLGVPVAGDQLYDGSGLSRRNRLRDDTLAGVLGLADEVRPAGAAAGADRAAGRRLHRLAGLPLRQGAGRCPGPGPRQDRHAHRRTRTGGCGRRRERRAGCPSWSSPTGSSPCKELEAQTLIDRIAGALGACRCGVGSSP